jgi:hypothetical protein
MEYLNENSRFPGRDVISGPHEYETGVLTVQLRL